MEATSHASRQDVEIPLDRVTLTGELAVPYKSKGVVLFAHGNGRNRVNLCHAFVAEVLNRNFIATLLFDLLDPDEIQDHSNVVNFALLTHRLVEATQWIFARREVEDIPVGYFATTMGSAAALKAAAILGNRVSAIVSVSDRTDRAGDDLLNVFTPTLSIVGEQDAQLFQLNRAALREIKAENKLIVVPGVDDLLERDEEVRIVADYASRWFVDCFRREHEKAVSSL